MELPARHPRQDPRPLTAQVAGGGGAPPQHGHPPPSPTRAPAVDPEADTLDVDVSSALAPTDLAPTDLAPTGRGGITPDTPCARPGPGSRTRGFLSGPDLLDDVATWGAAATPCGVFQLVPVRIERDLALITAWMNDPVVAAFWELSGPADTTAAHLSGQLDGDGRSMPCLGVLDGTPVGYWEIYRADLDPLARYYPARPHDTGIHLLVGGVADRGRGLGTELLRASGDLILRHRPDCRRVVAEPDLRNIPSVAAFLGAGFRFSAEVDLPGKRAALMIRDR
jgi:RimJ/RimL family protein N-acetyltransferase